jgi:hypothetical protein
MHAVATVAAWSTLRGPGARQQFLKMRAASQMMSTLPGNLGSTAWMAANRPVPRGGGSADAQ